MSQIEYAVSNVGKRLPRCRFGCDVAVFLVALQGCFCFPNDRKQWLCQQHFVKLDQEYTVLADIVSLRWAREAQP